VSKNFLWLYAVLPFVRLATTFKVFDSYQHSLMDKTFSEHSLSSRLYNDEYQSRIYGKVFDPSLFASVFFQTLLRINSSAKFNGKSSSGIYANAVNAEREREREREVNSSR
jgi:hypothetical protein